VGGGVLRLVSVAEVAAASADEVGPAWPTLPSGVTAWAQLMGDRLSADPASRSADDTERAIDDIASWLRVQVVGRDTVVVVEPRLSTVRDTWTRGARRAGLSEVYLALAPNDLGEIVTIDESKDADLPPAAARAAASAPSPSRRRSGRLRLWLADRTESVARRAVRSLQR
jgi:hypothetical protein